MSYLFEVTKCQWPHHVWQASESRKFLLTGAMHIVVPASYRKVNLTIAGIDFQGVNNARHADLIQPRGSGFCPASTMCCSTPRILECRRTSLLKNSAPR